MSENDLSDEAATDYALKEAGESGFHTRSAMIHGWQECRRRAEANRWAAFSDEELKNTSGLIYDSSVNLKLSREAEAELERRKAEGSRSLSAE